MKFVISSWVWRLFSFVTLLGSPNLKWIDFVRSILPRSLISLPGFRKSVLRATGMQGTPLRCASFTPSELKSVGSKFGVLVDWGNTSTDRFSS